MLDIRKKAIIEHALQELTGLDEQRIQAAFEPFFNGTWQSHVIATEDKQQLSHFLDWLGRLPTQEIEAMLRSQMQAKPMPNNAKSTNDGLFNRHFFVQMILLLCSYAFYDQFHYPQPQAGRYAIANNSFEKLKWLYRYRLNQLEVPEKNSDLVTYFKTQQLNFNHDQFQIVSKVSVASAGDLLAVDVLTPENTPHLFDAIHDFYSSADLVCANLESTVDSERPIGRNQSPGQPAKMNTSQAMFQKFCSEGNINYFSTANNHALDWGEHGVLATLERLDSAGVAHSGTNSSASAQEDVLIIEKNGIKIAMLSYTFDLNGNSVPEGKDYLVNEVRFNDQVCDLSLVQKHTQLAKEKGADIIIACCHWGWEFEMYPHQNSVRIAQTLVDYGVDVILGNHPHVSQPMARAATNGLIVYAHGDFVSYHPESRNSKIAYISRFDIVKGRSDTHSAVKTYITNLKMLPIYILNEKLSDNRYNCCILDFNEVCHNPQNYGLTPSEQEQLPHLRDHVLYNILLPQHYMNLLA